MENSPSVLVNIEDEMRQSYMDYAMSVIIGRALPDVRDGLKPVQRRVLYAMLGEGLLSNKKHAKCAAVVGEVMKRLHPHGDIPIYEALVRLAQHWNLRYPQIDGQGNFGSVDGDPPAAHRYTECRMSAVAEKLLEDLEKETVDFSPNFDETSNEPCVLPSVVPNLLVNGADGIAVGMATHMPPHNLSEVIAGAIAMIENPSITIRELMQFIPGPDFPTGGTICGRGAIVAAYTTGKGIISLRAKTHYEMLKGKSREIEAIVVTEIPFQVNKAKLIERIADLVKEGLIEGISNIRDETDRTGMRVVIELKREVTREVVLNQLFKLTPLEDSFGIINLAIVDGKPVVCSLHDLLRCFLNHRRDVVFRRTQFDLRKAQERMHLLDGFRIALLNLDEVIKLIRTSQTPKEAKDGLISRYSLSVIQAQAILDLRLQKLTGMERLAIETEHEALKKEIERLLLILADGAKIDAIITSELKEVSEKYGDRRRSEITDEVDEILVEDLIEDEEMVVTISHQGYIKRTPSSDYRAQKRGGKGVTGASTKDEDFTEHLFVASALTELLVFTSLGRLHWMKVYEVPESSRTARGRALVNLLSLKEGEKVAAVLPVKEYAEGRFVFMTTALGVVKKTDLMEFSRSRKSGIIACSVDDGDTLIGADITNGNDDVVIATQSGMAIRFAESDARAMGRSARGVIGIRLESGDKVVSMTIVPGAAENSEQQKDLTLLTVCAKGYGKRTLLEDYRVQGRGGKGLIDIQTDERNGLVAGAFTVKNNSGIMIVTSGGKIIRITASDISVIGRNTKGVRLINLDEGETVAAVARLSEHEEAPPVA